jgi:acetyl-CoA synthetase
MTETPTNIESVSHEGRLFRPPADFSKRARIRSLAQYRRLYGESIADPEMFWGRQAAEELVWRQPWTKVLEWEEPFAKWFVGGQLNVAENCLDRHLQTPTANKAALIWEGEPAGPDQPGEQRTLTYRQLHHEVGRLGNVLRRLGIKAGDRSTRWSSVASAPRPSPTASRIPRPAW